jgi:hypothetical protein
MRERGFRTAMFGFRKGWRLLAIVVTRRQLAFDKGGYGNTSIRSRRIEIWD